jgi:hypothetical protein
MADSCDGTAPQVAYNPIHGGCNAAIRLLGWRRRWRESIAPVPPGGPAAWSAARLGASGRAGVGTPAGDRVTRVATSVLDQPVWTWRRAQAHAREAYEHWRSHGGAAAFAAYRAAQDRADSAQDELAVRAHRSARST